MAITYVQIGSTVTVGAGGTSTVSFSSIPATYTDLLIKLTMRSNYAGNPEIANMTINGSALSFTNRDLFGTGSSTVSQQDNSRGPFTEGNNYTASVFSSSDVYISNYASSSNKCIATDAVVENNTTSAYQQLNSILWSNSAAITSISFSTRNGTLWSQFSTATLYGIKNS
jgi:hypothetical protein